MQMCVKGREEGLSEVSVDYQKHLSDYVHLSFKSTEEVE